MNRTDIHLHWVAEPPVSLHVVCAQRVLTSQELHHLAETVEKIEEFRTAVQLGAEELA